MIIKCLTVLILFVMPNHDAPVVQYEPNQRSLIPTVGAEVQMEGWFNGKVQPYRADIVAFTDKINEINRTIFPGETCCDIIVANTAFVMCNGNDVTAKFEYFNKPFLTIQRAVNAAGPQSNHCIIIYPGVYPDAIILEENTKMFFYPGATVGNITIANGCYLHFCAGAILDGDINDGGSVVSNAVIGGDGTLNGKIIISGGSTNITAYGHSWKGCSVSAGNLTSYIKNLTSGGQVEALTGSLVIIHNMTTVGNIIQGTLSGDGDLSIYNSNLNCTDKATIQLGGVWLIKDCSIYGVVSAILGSAGDLTVINCSLSGGLPLDYSNGDGGTHEFYDCHITGDNTVAVPPVILSAATARKFVLSACYINANGVTGGLNVGAIQINDNNTTVVIKGTTTLVSKGTGNSINALVAVNVKVQFGSEGNVAPNVNVTQTCNALFINALVE